MNHLLSHGLIALAGSIALSLLIHPILATFAMATFYTGRELYQYYVLGKTHKGRFDHEGYALPVALWLITLLYYAL